jgi:serine/threonine protein phosphatase PrpC
MEMRMPSPKYSVIFASKINRALLKDMTFEMPATNKYQANLLPAISPIAIWFQGSDLLLIAGSVLAVILIVALILTIVLLLLFLRRSRKPTQPPTKTSGDSATTPDQQAVAASQADTDEYTVVQPAESGDPLKTIPVGTVTADDIATSPSMRLPREVAEAQTLPISGKRPSNIAWHIAGLTDVGLRRDHNEDSLLMTEGLLADDTPYGLYVVADGLGGHQGGEIASRLSVDTIQEKFMQQPPSSATAAFGDWLRDVALAANHAVLSQQEDKNTSQKMGSTLVMALVIGHQVHIANVGDSRAYHLHQEGIRQVSIDHSLVERLVQIGQLTREEARKHKNRNVIYNTIGDKSDPEISLYHIAVEPGDRVLLCSDGLNDMLTDDQIWEISRSNPDPAEACKVMIETANIAGGNDNITTIIIQMDK